jgi:hypothetical protein
MDEVRLTVPVNPPDPVTVIVDVPAAPALIVTVVGLADRVKLAGGLTLNVTVTEWERIPLVPVTITANVPVAVNVHVRVEVPEPVTLVGDRAHDPLLLVRLTTPLKPWRPVIVIVEVAAVFVTAATVVGLAAIVKSWTVKATVALLVVDPLVPVTVTVYAPAEPEQDRVEVPEVPKTMLVGLSVQVRPVLGDTEEVRVTVPVNPFWAVTVIVDVPVAPARTVTLVGLAVTEKPVAGTV